VRLLADLDVLVVDCQATGASPAYGSVLEIGWGVVRANRPELLSAEAHWVALPSGHHVPPQVRKLTGYEEKASESALEDALLWRRLLAACSEAAPIPTAIHFARFELPFLREWAARLEPESPFPFDAVCVHAIANRLYPDLPRQSLRALAGFLGHSLHLTRRSLGHVEATAFVWRRLCSELERRGVVSWEQLLAFLEERAPKKTRSKKPKYPIDPQRYRSLPDEPGVYRFCRSNGDVLYVGKAASLKKRVSSHFNGRGGTLQAPEMLTQVSAIEVTVVASALEAALLESETIKALNPPYNVQLTGAGQAVWYVAPDFMAASNARTSPDALGPVPSEFSLRPLAALVALLRGDEPTPALRAEAVGVSALWPPEEAVFAAGWAELKSQHQDSHWREGEPPRRAALALAKRFLLAPVFTKDGEEAESLEGPASDPRGWVPARVARHLERAVAQAYRAYRRASWLSLLMNAEVVYREPGSSRVRLLVVERGVVVEGRDVALDYRPSRRVQRLRVGEEGFDRAMYDRLRILTTELKRICRDGGDVRVHWRPRRQLPVKLVSAVFALV
jgi:DNA polymerase III epsilon subunit-like protein